ncbi:acetyl-CoA synthase subunit gamma [Geomonas sp. Red32]|nr:acetyl-CoA synthase subunit gamma [Geomonas sp. Red32]
MRDHLGACKARWGIDRMNYMVPPGLYAIGAPAPEDPVLVTANYKMSFDEVRRNLAGRNVWLLVLETFGINVWCAAGKGTFGTDELVRRIRLSGLARAVNHRHLILPILGAPGVAAHEVAKQTGFTVRYAAIRAADLPAYLDHGMKTTEAMRELTFTLYERLVLVPVELVTAARQSAVIMAVLGALFAFAGGWQAGLVAMAAYLGAMLAGVAAAPVLLPWLPGRSFAVKGTVIGILWGGAVTLLAHPSPLVTAALFVGLPAVSAFYALNFTGCTTFTSRSGVKKEMRIALPVMGAAVAVSLAMLAVSRLL